MLSARPPVTVGRWGVGVVGKKVSARGTLEHTDEFAAHMAKRRAQRREPKDGLGVAALQYDLLH